MIFLSEMDNKLDDYKSNFCKSLNIWFEKEFAPNYKKGATTKLAKIFGISQGYMSQILNGDKCFESEIKRREVAGIIGQNYDEMIGVAVSSIGIRSISGSEVEKNPPAMNNVAEIEHDSVLKSFKNKEFVKNINEQLLKLESINPDVLREVEDYIQFKIGKYDRRKINDPNKIPETGDRRKAVG